MHFPSAVAGKRLLLWLHFGSELRCVEYLVTRPGDEGGNLLIDSPRFATQLVKRIEAMGGVRQMLSTHRDDIADHQY